jgi:hypothetical protein
MLGVFYRFVNFGTKLGRAIWRAGGADLALHAPIHWAMLGGCDLEEGEIESPWRDKPAAQSGGRAGFGVRVSCFGASPGSIRDNFEKKIRDKVKETLAYAREM